MKLLNQSQAEAVYSAMCALNNVSANAGIQLSFVGDREGDMYRFSVEEEASGQVFVFQGPFGNPGQIERYAGQAEFADAYGLAGEPEPEMVKHLGRLYKVVAKFPEALDARAANEYMQQNPGVGVLCVQRGIVYLADLSDSGVAA